MPEPTREQIDKSGENAHVCLTAHGGAKCPAYAGLDTKALTVKCQDHDGPSLSLHCGQCPRGLWK